ncbi:MAG: type II secretion system F family protein [Dehalococcoidia bacterium]|nr:type II secretion system F family protein [Dehalococcoidia bacterium]
MDPLIVLVSVTVFFAVVSVLVGLKRGTSGEQISSRLEQFRAEGEAPAAAGEPATSLKQHRSYSGLPILSTFLAQFKGSETVALHLDRAGVPLRVGEYYMIRWGMAVLFFFVPLIFGPSAFMLLISLGMAAVGYMLPAMWLSGKRKKRTVRVNAQLVDMLGMVANSIKSGYGLMQSFEFAARQIDAPLALELRRMLREANLGLSAEDALNALGQRIDSKDLDMVLTAVNIQRAVGGNLAEILDQVAFTMRERERVRGEISTLTAQQKMTGIVIGGLPVFMFAIFMVMNPAYMSVLFNELAGRIILLTAVGLEFLGYFTLKRMMAIDV